MVRLDEVCASQLEVCVIKYLMMSMQSCNYLLSISFWICVCLHMLCIKVNRKQVWGSTPRQQNGIHSRKSWNLGSNGPRTTSTKDGPKRASEQATRSSLWDGQPITMSPLLVLCPRSGLRPIRSIFTCFAFRFEPNWKSFALVRIQKYYIYWVIWENHKRRR